MPIDSQATSLSSPQAAPRLRGDPRRRRLASAAASILLVGFGLGLIDQWLGHEAELLRYRLVLHELRVTVRAMRPQAIARHRAIQLRVDLAHGIFRITASQRGPHPYETLEQTVWLPKALQITEAPAVVTALPTGQLSPGSIVITAPAHRKLFRLTTSERGLVQLHEEPIL